MNQIAKDPRIQEVLDKFPFEKVHDLIVHLDRKWQVTETSLEIPTIDDIRYVARNLLRDALKHEGQAMIANHLVAQAFPSGLLRLSYELESRSAFGTFKEQYIVL